MPNIETIGPHPEDPDRPNLPNGQRYYVNTKNPNGTFEVSVAQPDLRILLPWIQNRLTLLQGHRDTPQIDYANLASSLVQLRVLQDQVKQQAAVQQELLKRLRALLKLVGNMDLDPDE